MSDFRNGPPTAKPPRTATPRHAIPGENAEIARLSEMVVALLGELAMTNERIDTLERLLDQGAVVPREAYEAYAPDAQAQAERDAKRLRLVRKVFTPLRDAMERDIKTSAPDAPRA